MLELTVNHGMAHSILKEVAKSQCDYDANEGGGEMRDRVVRMVSHIRGCMELHSLEEDKDNFDENRMVIAKK